MTNQKLAQRAKVFRNVDLIILQAVADGTKPAALIMEMFEEEVKQSGLYYKSTNYGQFVVAKNKEKLDEISDIQRRFGELHRELGIKLGFPPTSVGAFLGNLQTKDDKIPIEYQGFFSFSKDHFTDEIKVIESWYGSAKKKFDTEMVQ